MQGTIRGAIAAVVAAGATLCLTATAAASTPGMPSSGRVGVFKVHFTVTGYYHLSGSTLVAGNGNTCAFMVRYGDTSGTGVWSTPWGKTVKAGGHAVSEISTSFDDYQARSARSGVVFQKGVENSAYITINKNTFDALGEGGSGRVTVDANGAGSFSFKNAPDQSLAGPSGKIAVVSGSVTWTCDDVPAAKAPKAG